MLVAHDPGHGHHGDPGCAHNGIIESSLVLEIAKSICDGTKWVSQMLLRDGPIGSAYSQRAELAARAGAKLVLLHHINANDDKKCHGLMAFYTPGDDLGQDVATAISRAAPLPLWRGGNATAATRDGWPRVAWCLDWYRKERMSAVLIEWGFASNAQDAAFLSSEMSRPSIVAAASVGIANAMHILSGGAP